MVSFGRRILSCLFIVIFVSSPLVAGDTILEPQEVLSPDDSSRRHISSPGDEIVLKIEENNPFNPEAEDPRDDHTRIYYKVADQGVTIRIYSVTGELVRTLAEDKAETEDRIDWDGRNDKGEVVGSGVYLVNLKMGKSSKTVKVVILK